MKFSEATQSLGEQVRAMHVGVGCRVLDGMSVLAVRGKDRATWLNGLITNDVRVLPAGRSVYTAIVGLKGKILTDAWVHARADELALVMPGNRVAEIAEHFDRYIVMEDVFVSPRDFVVVSLQGPLAGETCVGIGDAYNADRLGRGGLDVLVSPDDSSAFEAALEKWVSHGDVVMVTDEAWEIARLEAGVARFGTDFDTHHFVQEAAITGRAVSFQKGCYLGQEVVCRLEMRGQVQRCLEPMVIETETVEKGDAVMVGDVEVGKMTSAMRSVSLQGKSVGFAMLKRTAVEAQGPFVVRGCSATMASRPVA
jgi:tRNA-modifying protein YgfZ